MKCQHCNSEIPDNSIFCPECGEKQVVSQTSPPESVSIPEPISQTAVCQVCGTPIENGILFCPECGTPVSPNNDNISSGQKKSRVPVIIAVIVGAVVLLTILISIIMMLLRKDSSDVDSTTHDTAIEATEPDEEDILSDVDFNLSDQDRMVFGGLVKNAQNGETFLHLDTDTGYTFYGEDFDGTKILLEDVDQVYIDKSALPDGIFDTISSNQTLTIDGQLYLDSEKIYITPFTIWDENGNDMIEAFEEQEESNALNNDYILPQSSSRLLTDRDVDRLSIREINYAKNEIYARHGRLFDSAELQNYFNSKNWYHGTVSPEDFTNSMLSDIEQKNAEFLADTEFGMNSGGYQLDTN